MRSNALHNRYLACLRLSKVVNESLQVYRSRRTSCSRLIRVRRLRRAWDMLVRSSFWIRPNFENERSPEQFVTISERYIRRDTSMFGNTEPRSAVIKRRYILSCSESPAASLAGCKTLDTLDAKLNPEVYGLHTYLIEVKNQNLKAKNLKKNDGYKQ